MEPYSNLSKELKELRTQIKLIKSPHDATASGTSSPIKQDSEYHDDIISQGEFSDKENIPKEYLVSPSNMTESEKQMEENLKAKDSEVKMLWNVIKELHKGKPETEITTL